MLRAHVLIQYRSLDLLLLKLCHLIDLMLSWLLLLTYFPYYVYLIDLA